MPETTVNQATLETLVALAYGTTPTNERVAGQLEVLRGIGAWDHAAPTTQPVAIANPTGGTPDAEARTAIVSILNALRGAGIIAT